MTDEPPIPQREPAPPPPDDGPRDEQVAALLAVEPLDEMTRRRLVNTAMAATAVPDDQEGDELGRPGRSRLAVLLPVAAAIAIGVVVGALVVSQAVTAARLKDAATTPTGVCADIPPPDLGLLTTSAAGTGTVAGEAVNIILGTDATGETIAVVLRSEDCLIIRKDLLPPG
jgi:hypothetical protein